MPTNLGVLSSKNLKSGASCWVELLSGDVGMLIWPLHRNHTCLHVSAPTALTCYIMKDSERPRWVKTFPLKCWLTQAQTLRAEAAAAPRTTPCSDLGLGVMSAHRSLVDQKRPDAVSAHYCKGKKIH